MSQRESVITQLGYDVAVRFVDTLVSRVDIQVFGQEHVEAHQGKPAIFAFYPHKSHGDPKSAYDAIHSVSPEHIKEMNVPAKREYWFEDGDTLKDRLVMNLLRHHLPHIFFPGATILPLSFDDDTQAGVDVDHIIHTAKENNRSLLVAPEGTRTSRPFYDREIFQGTALLAKRTGLPIVPMIIRGMENVLPRGSAIPKVFGSEKPVIEVHFGLPIDPLEFGNNRKAIHRELVSRYKEMAARLYPDEIWEAPDVVVVGGGQIGTFLGQALKPVIDSKTGAVSKLDLTTVVRDYQTERAQQNFPKGTHVLTEVRDALANQPDMVVVATQNSTNDLANPVLSDIARYADHEKQLTVLLTQNGVDASKAALQAFAGRDNIAGIRLLPFNAVSLDETGTPVYNHKKKRIGIAPLDGKGIDESHRIAQLFRDLGFSVSYHEDYRELDWNKLFLNLVGFTTGVTVGVNAKDGLKDPELAKIEIEALSDLVTVLDAEGISIVDFPWQKPWNRTTAIANIMRNVRDDTKRGNLIENVFMVPGIRQFIGQQISKERNNQPPDAARKIQDDGRPAEPAFYLEPIIELGEHHGLQMPVQKAALDIIRRHNSGEINLLNMSFKERKTLFLAKVYEFSSPNQV